MLLEIKSSNQTRRKATLLLAKGKINQTINNLIVMYMIMMRVSAAFSLALEQVIMEIQARNN